MTIEASGPNAEQIKYWNEVSGPKWVAMSAFLDAQLEPIGNRTMDRALLISGERVLDVGCGCGATSIELARRVLPGGQVTGVDISQPMLAHAAQKAAAAEVTNVRFENADAQTHTFRDSFDLVFSRFGVMFFSDPTAAFANLHRSLREDGRLVFVCWQELAQNPWMFVPFMAAAQHLTLPPPPPPEAPGPFALADPGRIRSILAGAGYKDVALEDLKTDLVIGAGERLDEIVDILLQLGPTGAAMREAGSGLWDTVSVAVQSALQPYYSPAGLKMNAAAWIVTARA